MEPLLGLGREWKMLGKLLFTIIPVVVIVSMGMWSLITYWQKEYGYIEWSDFTREDGAKVFLLVVFSTFIGFLANLIYTLIWEV
jgi:hypothetical protein